MGAVGSWRHTGSHPENATDREHATPAADPQARVAAIATAAVRTVPEPLMNVREVARALGVSTATVYRLCNSGRLAHVRVANSVRVWPEDLRAFVGERSGP